MHFLYSKKKKLSISELSTACNIREKLIEYAIF